MKMKYENIKHDFDYDQGATVSVGADTSSSVDITSCETDKGLITVKYCTQCNCKQIAPAQGPIRPIKWQSCNFRTCCYKLNVRHKLVFNSAQKELIQQLKRKQKQKQK